MPAVTELEIEDFLVPVACEGAAVHVRNKRLAGKRGAPAVFFVHGATYPIAATFDLALDGVSWMDTVARAGWDTYGVDMRGFGGSTRAAAMERPAAGVPPLTTTDIASADLEAVVNYAREHRGVGGFALMASSWGCSVVGALAARQPVGLVALVQQAPQWLRDGASGGDPGGELGAYRVVSAEHARTRWLGAIPASRLDELVPAAWRDAFTEAVLDGDPQSRSLNPPAVRAPNGPIALSRDYWRVGKPFYDPANIRVPVLVIHGELDRDIPTAISQAYFGKLVNAPLRRFVEIGDATHMQMLERTRTQLFAETQLFLDAAVKA